jgi:hypothetical protein
MTPKPENKLSPRIQLLHGTTVSRHFYETVQAQLEGELPHHANSAALLTARELCGEDFWRLLNKGEHLLAGRCIAHMVDQKVLPLEPATPTTANAKRYQLATGGSRGFLFVATTTINT